MRATCSLYIKHRCLLIFSESSLDCFVQILSSSQYNCVTSLVHIYVYIYCISNQMPCFHGLVLYMNGDAHKANGHMWMYTCDLSLDGNDLIWELSLQIYKYSWIAVDKVNRLCLLLQHYRRCYDDHFYANATLWLE